MLDHTDSGLPIMWVLVMVEVIVSGFPSPPIMRVAGFILPFGVPVNMCDVM